jgi:hypothetical protein
MTQHRMTAIGENLESVNKVREEYDLEIGNDCLSFENYIDAFYLRVIKDGETVALIHQDNVEWKREWKDD